MIHLDTHVVAWLYAKRLDLLPESVKTLIESNELWISSMVILELEYLKETGRTNRPSDVVVSELSLGIGLKVSSASLSRIVQFARHLSWTRDPFDRIIVGNAMADGCRLLTADQGIRRHFDEAIWD
jgi:PIN domain nuclease of toxin-antitoxin system